MTLQQLDGTVSYQRSHPTSTETFKQYQRNYNLNQ